MKHTLDEAEDGKAVPVRVHSPDELGPVVVDDGGREPVEHIGEQEEEDVGHEPAVETWRIEKGGLRALEKGLGNNKGKIKKPANEKKGFKSLANTRELRNLANEKRESRSRRPHVAGIFSETLKQWL